MRGSHHPGRPAVQRRGHPLPVSATQRERIRRCQRDPGTFAPQRFHRCAQPDDAGLAARHRAHLHRDGATMIDPRRAEHSAPPGAPSAATTGRRPHVVVVVAAVDVVEKDHFLGGRVGGWSETLPDGTAVAMNRGFHAFFRQYHNLRKLLARVDPQLSMLTPVDDYPLIDARGRRDTFRGLPRTPPLNAAVSRCAAPPFGCGTCCGSTPALRRRCSPCRCPIFTTASMTVTPKGFCAASTFPSPRSIWRSRCSRAASSRPGRSVCRRVGDDVSHLFPAFQ